MREQVCCNCANAKRFGAKAFECGIGKFTECQCAGTTSFFEQKQEKAMKLKHIYNSDFGKLSEYGYKYSIMEAGWISKNGATIVIEFRQPYVREVMQFRGNLLGAHIENLQILQAAGLVDVKKV